MFHWFTAGTELEAGSLHQTELYQRVWAGGWWILASLMVLALGELVARPGENPTVTVLQLSTAVGVGIAIAVIARVRTAPGLVGTAMLTLMWCGLGSGAIAVATGHTSTSLIVLVALTSGAAAFLPWGWRPQLVVAVWNSAMFPLEIVVGGHGTLLESSRELVALAVINFGSVFVARELERQRRLMRREQRQRLARERELESQRAFLYQVIDINPHLVFAKDRDGRFTLVNQAVAALYGTTVSGLIGRTDADFNANAAEVEHFRRDDLAVLDSGSERVIAEERITDAAGRQRWLRTIKRPLVERRRHARSAPRRRHRHHRRSARQPPRWRTTPRSRRRSRASARGSSPASTATICSRGCAPTPARSSAPTARRCGCSTPTRRSIAPRATSGSRVSAGKAMRLLERAVRVVESIASPPSASGAAWIAAERPRDAVPPPRRRACTASSGSRCAAAAGRPARCWRATARRRRRASASCASPVASPSSPRWRWRTRACTTRCSAPTASSRSSWRRCRTSCARR